MFEQLSKYNGTGENMYDEIFSTNPAEVLASQFILQFFPLFTSYTRKQGKGEKIATYIIS